MPELDLPDLHLPESGVYLFAVMDRPHDVPSHRRFVEAARISVIKKVLAGRTLKDINPAAMPLVVEAATGHTLEDETRGGSVHSLGPCYIRGEVAALILVYVLACATHVDEGEKATAENARDTITAAATRGHFTGVGRSYLIECWNDYAAVSHFWAIKFFMPDLWQEAGMRGGSVLAEFLAYAEALRAEGERHRAARSQTTLLDPAKTWRVPSRFVLPRVRLDLPRPSQMKSMMERWQA